MASIASDFFIDDKAGRTRGKKERIVTYVAKGAAKDLFISKAKEVLLDGPAGTGKSRGCLEKIHLINLRHRNVRCLMVRKTRASMTETCMATFEKKVVQDGEHVVWNSPTQQYRYPKTKSIITVSGLDKPSKIMSSDWDIIYVQEATELSENDWEMLTTRLRNNTLAYQQLIADCNPQWPTHWLKQRCEANRCIMFKSRHEDNPMLWDEQDKQWTEFGKTYIATLDALTGVRYLRLRLGIWASAEGLVYDGWDPAKHIIDRFPIPDSWDRLWTVDFGYKNPFVWQAWAKDPEGRLFRYREIYKTQRLVEDHCAVIKALTRNEPRPKVVVCDHDAEDRATLEKHLGDMGIRTVPADKSVSPGLQVVMNRLKIADDNKPRMSWLRYSLGESKDPNLIDAHLPTCSEEEFESYVWDLSNNRKRGEEPVKQSDHGKDAERYLAVYVDGIKGKSSIRFFW